MAKEIQINLFEDIYQKSYEDILIILEISSMGNFHTPLAFKSSPEQEFKRVRPLSVFLLLQIPPLLTPAFDSTHLSIRHLPVQKNKMPAHCMSFISKEQV